MVPIRQSQEVAHDQPEEAALENYPHGRGYGHDYMRGGEVLGGYGYAERDEYSKARGELDGSDSQRLDVERATRRSSPRTDTPNLASRSAHLADDDSLFF